MSGRLQQLDEQSTPISSDVISIEDTPASIVPSLKVNQTSDAKKSINAKQIIRRHSAHPTGKSLGQNSAPFAKGDVEGKCELKGKGSVASSAEDIMSKLDRTQAGSTVSSEDDECKKSSGPNNNNKAVKVAARGRAKGAEKRPSLKKCRDSVQNDNKALQDNEKKAKDDSRQEANVGGILRSDETESAEISCSPVKATQSDENSASDRSSPVNTKKTKGKIYDDEHKGRLSRRNMNTRGIVKVEVTSESEPRKAEGSQKNNQSRNDRNSQRECDAISPEHHPEMYVLV